MRNNLLPFLFLGLTILFLVQCVPDTPTGNIVDIANPDFHLSKPSVRSIDGVNNFIEFTEGPQQNIDGYAIFEIKNGFSYLDNFTRVQPNGFFNTINTSEINDLQLAIASFIELPSDTDISHLQSTGVHVTSRTFNGATSYRVFSDTVRFNYVQEVSDIWFENRNGALWLNWKHNFFNDASLLLSYAPDSINFNVLGSVKLKLGSGYNPNYKSTLGYDFDGIFRFQAMSSRGEISEGWDTRSNSLSACTNDPNALTAPSSLNFQSGLNWIHVLSFEEIPCFDYGILFEQKSSENTFKHVGWLDSSMNSFSRYYPDQQFDFTYKIGFVRFGQPIVFTESISVTFNGNDWVQTND